MKETRQIIKQTRKKFILYSFLGLVIVFFVSFFSFKNLEHQIEKQIQIQSFYDKIGQQINLINSISTLAEGFDDTQSPADRRKLVNQFSSDVEKLKKMNSELSSWLKEKDFLAATEFQEILHDKDSLKKMNDFLVVSKTFMKDGVDSKYQIKRNINFLSKSSRDGVGDIINQVLVKVSKTQNTLLREFKSKAVVFVLLSILQIFLIWLLVFKPLYSTIAKQNEKLKTSITEANKGSQAKTDFLANISHEIRTPMTAIIGYSNILTSKSSTEDEKLNAAKIVGRNSQHLLDLIGEVLDISKIEAGKFEFEFQDVRVVDIVNEVYSLLSIKAAEKNIDFDVEHVSDFPSIIQSDPVRLKQLLFNILGNAIKFTEKGSVHLIISYNKDNNKMEFIVKDTGVGISTENMTKIFKPFEQIDTSVSRTYGGTGLGLALSRELAKGLGGEVKIVDTKVGVGTTFQISVDIGDKEKVMHSQFAGNIIQDIQHVSKPIENVLSNKKLLVVDDAKENARLFKTYLLKAGAKVEIAYNGDEALDLTDKIQFDAILLDIQMPGKDGFEVIQELRKKKYSKPVIALTAHATKDEKEKTKNAGFDKHITKPVKPDVLVHSVKSSLT